MDELDLLKQDWQKEKSDEFPHYSEQKLLQMSKNKSVSVAKWVFLIGVLEILFWKGVNYVMSFYIGEEDNDNTIFDQIYDVLQWGFKAFPYIFIGIVLYLHYKMKNTECPHRLMKKIIWMKETIHWNIKLFLSSFIISFSLGFLSGIFGDGECKEPSEIPFAIEWIINIFALCILVMIVFGFIVIMKHIYYFIYGRFIKQLEENYKELSKIETP